MNTANEVQTTTFFTCGESSKPLFRVNPDIPLGSALEHASNLMTCIRELSLEAALGDAGKQSVWAVHYLSDMARAVIEDALSGRTVAA